MIPNGYGIAWINYASADTVCYPIPLNLVIQFVRTVWFFLLRDHSGLVRLANVIDARNDGYREGYAQGCEAAKLQADRALIRFLKGLNDVPRDEMGDPVAHE